MPVQHQPSFGTEVSKTVAGMLLGLLVIGVLLSGQFFLRTGSLHPHRVSPERCQQLRENWDGIDPKTGEPAQAVWFGLSCDDEGGGPPVARD